MGFGLNKYLFNNGYKYGSIGYGLYKAINLFFFMKNGYWRSDKDFLLRKHVEVFGKTFDFDNPQTLNEKIKWLKVNDRRAIHTLLADKYTMREYMGQHYGEDKLIPLQFVTDDWHDITMDVIPDYPCIIKATHTSGGYLIIKDKKDVNIKQLRFWCRAWLGENYYFRSKEWQYKNSHRRIVIEKLLQCKDGYIPNDYKLHYINGELAFVYCSVARETLNKRNIYDKDWNPLYFSWVEKWKNSSTIRGEEITAPQSFDEMKLIGADIAKMFDYVRVDFYDVDGKLYYGEITFHHGGGNDVFRPEEYDLKFGKMLKFINAKVE